MMSVDFAISLLRVVEKKQKNPAIFAISVMLRGQPAFDGRMSFLPPIRFIVAIRHRSLVVLKVFGRKIFVVVVLWQRSENAMVSFWSFLTDF